MSVTNCCKLNYCGRGQRSGYRGDFMLERSEDLRDLRAYGGHISPGKGGECGHYRRGKRVCDEIMGSLFHIELHHFLCFLNCCFSCVQLLTVHICLHGYCRWTNSCGKGHIENLWCGLWPSKAPLLLSDLWPHQKAQVWPQRHWILPVGIT